MNNNFLTTHGNVTSRYFALKKFHKKFIFLTLHKQKIIFSIQNDNLKFKYHYCPVHYFWKFQFSVWYARLSLTDGIWNSDSQEIFFNNKSQFHIFTLSVDCCWFFNHTILYSWDNFTKYVHICRLTETVSYNEIKKSEFCM